MVKNPSFVINNSIFLYYTINNLKTKIMKEFLMIAGATTLGVTLGVILANVVSKALKLND